MITPDEFVDNYTWVGYGMTIGAAGPTCSNGGGDGVGVGEGERGV